MPPMMHKHEHLLCGLCGVYIRTKKSSVLSSRVALPCQHNIDVSCTRLHANCLVIARKPCSHKCPCKSKVRMGFFEVLMQWHDMCMHTWIRTPHNRLGLDPWMRLQTHLLMNTPHHRHCQSRLHQHPHPHPIHSFYGTLEISKLESKMIYKR